MYLIGPAALDSGPQVLYVLYGKGPALREYSSQSDFLHRLHGSGALQDEVLERLNPGFVKFMNMGDFASRISAMSIRP